MKTITITDVKLIENFIILMGKIELLDQINENTLNSITVKSGIERIEFTKLNDYVYKSTLIYNGHKYNKNVDAILNKLAFDYITNCIFN